MEELTNSIKRPNLRITDIEEGEEVEAKGIHNIFNEIIAENFPNLRKFCLFRYRKPPGHQTDLSKTELPHNILSLNNKHREQRRNTEHYKREKTNNI
jgi:hypothetical protein